RFRCRWRRLEKPVTARLRLPSIHPVQRQRVQMDVEIQRASVTLHRRHRAADPLLPGWQRSPLAPRPGIQAYLGADELPLVVAKNFLEEQVDRLGEEPGIAREMQA